MTRHSIKLATLFAVISMSRICMAADISGNWIAQIATQGEPQYARVSLQVNGTSVTGLWGEAKINGTLAADKLDIELTSADGSSAGALTGTFKGDTFTAVGTVRNAGGRGGGRGGGTAAP